MGEEGVGNGRGRGGREGGEAKREGKEGRGRGGEAKGGREREGTPKGWFTPPCSKILKIP